MILQDLRQAIENHGTATRSELAKKFSLSQDGVDAMIGVWEKKGKVKRIVINTGLGGEDVRYHWLTSSSEIPLTVRF
ncbi:FeoC-like transcriptional regulator [Parasalinivibrio latis]|uniref:FeoC-like transcriptional regulator n=1 Tax=Parasalinivibrio latis TaxID=2952610 RepID=UPI0030E54267